MIQKQRPNAVRAARERAGLSQEQAAAKAGTTRTTVYLAERGLLSEAVAKKLAPVLGVKVSELLRENAEAGRYGDR